MGWGGGMEHNSVNKRYTGRGSKIMKISVTYYLKCAISIVELLVIACK